MSDAFSMDITVHNGANVLRLRQGDDGQADLTLNGFRLEVQDAKLESFPDHVRVSFKMPLTSIRANLEKK